MASIQKVALVCGSCVCTDAQSDDEVVGPEASSSSLRPPPPPQRRTADADEDDDEDDMAPMALPELPRLHVDDMRPAEAGGSSPESHGAAELRLKTPGGNNHFAELACAPTFWCFAPEHASPL